MEERRKYDNLTDSQKISMLLDRHEELLTAFPYGIEHHKKEHREAEESKQENEKLIRDLKHTIVKTCVLVVLTSLMGLLVLGANVQFANFLRGLNVIQ